MVNFTTAARVTARASHAAVLGMLLLGACSAFSRSSRSPGIQQQVFLTAVNGERLPADLYGRGDHGVVIIAHGGYSTNATWAGQARALAGRGYRVLVFESRAVGAIAAGRDIPCIYDAVCQAADVLVAVRWLRQAGVSTVAVIGGSMGAAAVAQAAVDASAGEISRIVLLAPAEIAAPERIQAPKLFITARDDANSAGPRLPGIQAQYDRATEPKRFVVLEGSAHGQLIFATRDSATVLQEILSFLSHPAGMDSLLWAKLRQEAGPGERTHLIHTMASAGIDPALLIDRLATDTHTVLRRAIILSLGHFSEAQLSRAQRSQLTPRLLAWYRDDPDPGVHAAIDWLLRHGRRGERARLLDWSQGDAVRAIDRELAAGPGGPRRWLVDREGHTMVTLYGPIEYEMGSPPDEPGRAAASDSPPEPQHPVRIPRSFAIANKEVTVEQFRRFLDASPGVKARHGYEGDSARMREVMATFSPDADGPQVAVTWYEAAMYCNWLSKQNGIPESEWVYPTDPAILGAGMRMPANYLGRTGYRLPTEAEWEYAVRAGSRTARFFGDATGYLSEYAWYSVNPPQRKADPVDPNDPKRTWPVGQLEPNDFGLFDVYGNVWEWTQSPVDLGIPSNGPRADVEEAELIVRDSVARARRGGSFPYGASAMRSASRGTRHSFPTTRRDNVGFRVARTIRP